MVPVFVCAAAPLVVAGVVTHRHAGARARVAGGDAHPRVEEFLLTKSYRFAATLAVVALSVGASSAFADHGHDGHHGDDHHGGKVVKSDLFGSTPRPIGPVLFGVNPGGAPWVVDEARVKVRRDGRIKARIEGLVIPTAPQNGTNPLSHLAATVYCGGTAVGTTSAVPFSAEGDARIDEQLAKALPKPCLVPAVLINPAPNGVVNTATYIAASGK